MLPPPLKLYTIYNRPLDYPDLYVVRMFEYDKPTAWFRLAPTLEEARKHIPPGLIGLVRKKNDDPNIVETWL